MKTKGAATLAIDIGGTGIKMMVLDAKGVPETEYIRELTPHPATYNAVSDTISKMVKSIKHPFLQVAAGFPGVVIQGVIMSAPNLHPSWVGVNFAEELEKMTGFPARVANDADVQGLGDVSGSGVELVITLGTGLGSALFLNGKLIPNLELGHHPFRKQKTYEDLLGIVGLKKSGKKKWMKHLQEAIEILKATFNYDHLYIGGGNAKKITFTLPPNVSISSNTEGVLGGYKLWHQ